MDTLTHMALGACIGQAIGYKKVGGKALVFGALCGLIPDLDVLGTPFLGEFGSWKYHRHITHSLWCVALLGPFMGWGLWRHYGRQAGHLPIWLSVMVLALLSHPLLDICTIYGTQFLAPLSNHRFEIPAISIIDPVYSLILLLPLLALRKALRPYARLAATTALFVTTSYIFFGWYLNTRAEAIAATQLDKQHIQTSEIKAFTTIFQPFLRRVVVRDANTPTLRVGFVSTFSPDHIYWGCQLQAAPNIQSAIRKTESGRIFDWFSGENLNIMEGHSTSQYIVTDARYGVPGDSLFGWWGQAYTVDKTTQPMTATYTGRVQFERNASLDAIKNLFRAAYGLPNTFMMTKDEGC